MRKSMFALFALTFLVLGGVGATTVLAKPVGPAPVQFEVEGRFNPGAVAFPGTVTVESFVEQDGQLAVQGTLTPATEGLISPLAVTIVASAAASEDAAGCRVAISTSTFFFQEKEGGITIFLDGAAFTLGETREPDAARELCRVVDTAAKNPADQRALARALNKVLRGA